MNNYFHNLEKYLEEKYVIKSQIEEIVNDYKEFYDEYLNSGLTNEEIFVKLGTPKDIYNSLRGTIIREKKATRKSKLVSTSPFIATIIFFLLGYFLTAWHPGWLVFFLVPISGVFASKGSLFKKITGSLIFIGIVVAFLLPYYQVLEWKYSWLFIIAFLIPSSSLSNKTTKFKNILSTLSLIISIIAYIILVSLNVSIPLALLSFLLPFLVGIYTGHVEVFTSFNTGRKGIIITTSFIIFISLFIIFGLTFHNWAYIWQILLLPFIITIIVNNDKNDRVITSIMPFIATIIFFSVGYFCDAWAISWLAYLLIPIAGVLKG